MTEYQRVQLSFWLLEIHEREPAFEFHHGGAEGADTMAHDVAYAVGCRDLHVWLPAGRSWPKTIDTTVHRTGRPPLKRNELVIAGADRLYATPRQPAEIRRSGTWATVRLARDAGIPVTILSPVYEPEGGAAA